MSQYIGCEIKSMQKLLFFYTLYLNEKHVTFIMAISNWWWNLSFATFL